MLRPSGFPLPGHAGFRRFRLRALPGIGHHRGHAFEIPQGAGLTKLVEIWDGLFEYINHPLRHLLFAFAHCRVTSFVCLWFRALVTSGAGPQILPPPVRQQIRDDGNVRNRAQDIYRNHSPLHHAASFAKN